MVNPTTTTKLAAAGLLVLATACPLGGGGGDDAYGGEIEFRGEQPLLPGLDVDTGWIPEVSPASVRAAVTAGGGVVVTARATTDGSSLSPVAGSGEISMEGALTMEISARIDTAGIEYEDVVSSFEYAIPTTQQPFEPFSLGATATATAPLPAQDLGSVPIPSVPGASLAISVTGGELVADFEGTCADTLDGNGQYMGTTTLHGTLSAAASIVIEIPVVGDETFGPFEFDVPIPESHSSLDLGVRSLSTGEPVEGVQVCGAGDPTGGETVAPGETGSGTDGGSMTTGADGSTGDSGTTTDEPTTGDTTTTGNPLEPDPDYPPPEGGECPPDYVLVGIEGRIDNEVCLPPCTRDGLCPFGATGTAEGACAVNPLSSQDPCLVDEDCPFADEICIGDICFAQPATHCVLFCDEASECPDSMACIGGACSYPS